LSFFDGALVEERRMARVNPAACRPRGPHAAESSAKSSGLADGATVSALGRAPGATLAPYSGEVVFP